MRPCRSLWVCSSATVPPHEVTRRITSARAGATCRECSVISPVEITARDSGCTALLRRGGAGEGAGVARHRGRLPRGGARPSGADGADRADGAVRRRRRPAAAGSDEEEGEEDRCGQQGRAPRAGAAVGGGTCRDPCGCDAGRSTTVPPGFLWVVATGRVARWPRASVRPDAEVTLEVVVVGGGVSGLAAAFRLSQAAARGPRDRAGGLTAHRRQPAPRRGRRGARRRRGRGDAQPAPRGGVAGPRGRPR